MTDETKLGGDSDKELLQAAAQAWMLLRTARHGVLSTVSQSRDGWPFGSLAPFVCTAKGHVVLVLSDLAEHTRNLRKDPRASLFVQDPNGAPEAQSTARVTVLGKVHPADETLQEGLLARYCEPFPEARGFVSRLDFRVYLLDVLHLRFIGGFGRVAWAAGTVLQGISADAELELPEDQAIAQIEARERDLLALCTKAYSSVEATFRRVVAIDAWGLEWLVETQEGPRRLYASFPVQHAGPCALHERLASLRQASLARLARQQARADGSSV